jgi:hypothetical protein
MDQAVRCLFPVLIAQQNQKQTLQCLRNEMMPMLMVKPLISPSFPVENTGCRCKFLRQTGDLWVEKKQQSQTHDFAPPSHGGLAISGKYPH